MTFLRPVLTSRFLIALSSLYPSALIIVDIHRLLPNDLHVSVPGALRHNVDRKIHSCTGNVLERRNEELLSSRKKERGEGECKCAFDSVLFIDSG